MKKISTALQVALKTSFICRKELAFYSDIQLFHFLLNCCTSIADTELTLCVCLFTFQWLSVFGESIDGANDQMRLFLSEFRVQSVKFGLTYDFYTNKHFTSIHQSIIHHLSSGSQGQWSLEFVRKPENSERSQQKQG